VACGVRPEIDLRPSFRFHRDSFIRQANSELPGSAVSMGATQRFGTNRRKLFDINCSS
jgi:hypothetical protein